jgi:hypothetical protein
VAARSAVLCWEANVWHDLLFGIAKGNLHWLDVCCTSSLQLNARRWYWPKHKFHTPQLAPYLVKNIRRHAVFNSYFIHSMYNACRFKKRKEVFNACTVPYIVWFTVVGFNMYSVTTITVTQTTPCIQSFFLISCIQS